MSARAPRRSFANPFVVTVAAATLPAACYVESGTGPASPQGPRTARTEPARPRDHRDTEPTVTTVSNPPRPQPQPEPAPPPVTTVTNPPRPQQPVDTSQTSPPTPGPRPTPSGEPVTQTTRTWTVRKSGGTCTAVAAITGCPTGAVCNPPPPAKYACPPQLADGDSVTITKTGNAPCFIEQPPMKCPPNVMCNPPPPQQVACPK